MLDQIALFISSLLGGKIILLLVFFAFFGIMFYIVYKIIFYLLKKIVEKTNTDLDDKLLECMRDPIRLFILSLTIFLAINLTYPDFKINEKIGFSEIYSIILIFLCAFALNRFISNILEWYKKEIISKTDTRTKFDEEMISVIQKVLRFGIYGLALMMALCNLGIEITPLLAGLGIASLAVALALQDSLGNFIAGINISVDRPLKKDDLIRTDFGIEGIVQEIGWRSTKILTFQNNYVIIPNTKLAQSIITNYYRPDKTITQIGNIGVSHNSDVNHVSDVIKNTIKKTIAKSNNFVKDFEPIVFFDSFGDFSLNFKYVYKIKKYTIHLAATNEINRAIFYEFKKENIIVPFPTRLVHLHQRETEKK